MQSQDTAQLQSFVYATFCSHVALSADEMLDGRCTLADIVSKSDRLHNSLDLMESFAKTSNAVNKQFGLRLRLPAFPLDTPLTTVIEAFLAQAATKLEH